jgi:cation:H+ antiporter
MWLTGSVGHMLLGSVPTSKCEPTDGTRQSAARLSEAIPTSRPTSAGVRAGSHIFNVLFTLGMSALIAPSAVNVQPIQQDVPIMIGVSAPVLLMMLDGALGWLESAVPFARLVGYAVTLIAVALTSRRL